MKTSVPFIFLVAVTAALQAQVVKPNNPLGNDLKVVAAGRDLYNRSCTTCHGPDGTEGDRAPALAESRRYFRLSEAAIYDAIKNGIAGSPMPAAGLPDNDVWRIVAFIRNIRSTASDNIVPGDPERGMRIFEGNIGCKNCHMIRGHGGVLGPDLSSIGAELTLKRLRAALTEAGAVRPGYQPVRVTTRDGQVVRGIAKNEDAFSIDLIDEKGKLHLFTREELREVAHEKISPMPHDIDKKLTARDFQDLIAMLSRQARTKVRLEQQGESEIGR